MTRQTTAPLEHVNLNATNRSARELASMVADGYINLDPPYQRGAVWTLDQRIGLVRSWLTGVPIPALIINNRTSAWWKDTAVYDVRVSGPEMAVVDGKQRILCAVAWFGGEFAVPASWFLSEYVERTEDTDDGPYVRYTGLTVVGRRLMANRAFLPVAEGTLPTQQAEAEVYLLVNGGGTPQTDADMANAARVVKGE